MVGSYDDGDAHDDCDDDVDNGDGDVDDNDDILFLKVAWYHSEYKLIV